MRHTDIFNEHFRKICEERNEYACKYCQKIFAKHVTRMFKHFVKFDAVPVNIKDPVVKSIIDTENSDSKNAKEMSISERNVLWEMFSRAVYTSGIPFSIVEHKYWIEFFKMLNPSFTLPTRKNLSEGLLDAEYNRVREEVNKCIKQTAGYGIQIDAWTNIRYEPIVNTVVTTPEPMLYASNYTKTEHHTGEFFHAEIKRSILECGKDRCFSVCTDSASAMVKAWKLLENDLDLKNLPISYYGCAAHAKNLLATDILKQPSCKNLLKKVTSIINAVNGSQVLKERFKEIQKEDNNAVSALKLPVKTRWCYVVDSIQSVIKTRVSLVKLAQCSKMVKYLSETVRNLILNEEIWIEADQLCFLLQQIKIWISALESDKSIISKVPEACKEIQNHLSVNLPLSFVPDDEAKKILAICKTRCMQMLRPIHFASNILDPGLQGSSLNDKQKVEGLNHILKITLALKLNQEVVHKELTDYMKKDGFWSYHMLWTVASDLKNSPRVWWSTVCCNTLLSKVSSVILSMPATSAATERTFSFYSHIHTKKRNRLTSERAGKVVFIGKNLHVLHRPQENFNFHDIEGMDFDDNYDFSG